MQAVVDEIAPGVHRINTFIPEIDLGFSQFLFEDDEPLLYHTGMKGIFPLVREAVAKVLDPSTLRWIGFSHYEPDECGSLNEWLALAPRAQAVCSFVGAQVDVNDGALRPARSMGHGEVLTTGRRRFRYLRTPHFPHGWDAGLMFEESDSLLLASDLFHQSGNVEALTESDVVGRFQATLTSYQQSPFVDYMPYTRKTQGLVDMLAALAPRRLATMHGSVFVGDGAQALLAMGKVLKETLDRES